ncbi:MAG: glycoside hydrolase, partial [Flammeovirgaceae bacterium]|nr:glycoside hydrolase [Flammeovirgaceae bacterium]
NSLRMNMPATSIRDLVIHEDDLVIGTHGRSIWVMDNISALREMARVVETKSSALFSPVQATRVRFNMFTDTPFPPEEPTGQNPPDGAILDYYFSHDVEKVIIEIWDEHDKRIKVFSSDDQPEWVDTTRIPHPTYWIRPFKSLSAKKGHHRLVWDLRYPSPRGTQREFAISAVHKNTPTGPQGPFVKPGKYRVRLIAWETMIEKFIDVRLDPRVVATAEDIAEQSKFSLHCYDQYHKLQEMRESLDKKLSDPKAKWKKGKKDLATELMGSGQPGNPDVTYGSIYEADGDNETIVDLQEKYLYINTVLQSADVRPTRQVLEGIKRLDLHFEKVKARFVYINE